ncbi:hypothetical protein MBLNU457_g2934t1 [Dothideomycetes sp. NU457]
MPGALVFNDNIGETIPADTPHAVSVSLPTWAANVGYEEGQEWVVSKMKCGYPRFFIHPSIQRFAATIVAKYGHSGDKAMLFPSRAATQRAVDFFQATKPGYPTSRLHILEFVPDPHKSYDDTQRVLPKICALLYPEEDWPVAKQVWQHTGDGVSSRRAEFCEKAYNSGLMVEKSTLEEAPRMKKGPRRYQRKLPEEEDGHINGDGAADGQDPTAFVEERFGRNLSLQFAAQAKLATRRRIAGSLSQHMDLEEALAHLEEVENIDGRHGFSVDDVYLFPTGMSSIFNTHRIMMAARENRKSIMFGFPYVDTLKILEKWGPGAVFYGYGSAEDIDDLEQRLKNGERFLSLFCEFPGNPLLKSPDLKRLRSLADAYDFAIVIDETIGNFLNVNVLPYADVVVSSLTKVFSGDSNVMGGSMILNPQSQYHTLLKQTLAHEYEDTLFEEDAVFLERNSRDFVSRIARINANAEAICDVLLAHHRIKQVNYPKHAPSRKYYDACRLPNGGYGGLLSCTFFDIEDAKVFYDNMNTAKGPSLGTNFTLASPFVLLAHYGELEWAAKYGCEENLIRFSVGLEDTDVVVNTFKRALDAMDRRHDGQ